MTPLELRADIPALGGTTYLNTGASGPSPGYVVEAAQTALADHVLGPSEYESGPVAIEADDADAAVELLADRSIVVRSLPGEVAIRVSLHAFNTGEAIDRPDHT